jgi:TonB family protein
MFSLLPAPKSRWREFVFGYGINGVALGALLLLALLRPQIIREAAKDYHIVTLVSTPAPVNHEPAPIRVIEPPRVTAQLREPIPENRRIEAPRPKIQAPEESTPKLQIAPEKPEPVIVTKPVIPRQLVKTNVFSTGSSATPTIAAAPSKVQTGGFGDPNGVPAQETHGRPVNIAQLGSFDLPAGPGFGNGTGGAKGAKGVVSSAGFGNGVATGDGSGHVSASRGTVRQGGFGDADGPVQLASKRTVETASPKLTPVEILSKPVPTYTEEARRMKIEGEVLLEVVFEASGKLRVLRVVRGLGHGLDENAVKAAEQIHFKPAQREGQASDSTATLHIVFQLA